MVCRLQRESRMRTTAVIAAFNEEKTIADVCRSLVSSPLIDEVIVVSDGSTDSTVEIARSIDGVRNRGDVLNFFHLKMQCGPVLSGIRVMRREVFDCVPPQYQAAYKIEAALNCFCSRAGYRQRHTVIHNLNHVLKESKRGLADGLLGRWKMMREVFIVLFDLHVFETWRNAPEPEPETAEYDLFE